MRESLDDKLRLLHILQAISYVDEFLADRSKESLYDEPMFRYISQNGSLNPGIGVVGQ